MTEQPTDPPNPDLDELQQRELEALPAVSVRVDHPVSVHQLPARMGPAFSEPITSAAFNTTLGRDLKRSRAVLLSDVGWLYSHTKTGAGVPWPANVPLVITHADYVYAKASSTSGTISVITEVWAD